MYPVKYYVSAGRKGPPGSPTYHPETEYNRVLTSIELPLANRDSSVVLGYYTQAVRKIGGNNIHCLYHL